MDVVNIMAIALFIALFIVVIIVTIIVIIIVIFIIIITIIFMSLAQIERVLDTCVTVRYSVSPTRRRG